LDPYEDRIRSGRLIRSNNRASKEFIKLTANPSQGTGGLCFGDSGGPDVLSGTTSCWR
jgi:hypothetical protein